MDKPLTPLEIIASQRDSLAVAFHNSQVEIALLKQSLQQTNELLESERARIADMEPRIAKLENRLLQTVDIAGDADTAAAA